MAKEATEACEFPHCGAPSIGKVFRYTSVSVDNGNVSARGAEVEACAEHRRFWKEETQMLKREHGLG